MSSPIFARPNARFVEELIRKEKITLIGEMANSILHDFRSPVTAIQLAIGAIKKHSPAIRRTWRAIRSRSSSAA